jgi:methanogenic corrinoid protein MtbC1
MTSKTMLADLELADAGSAGTICPVLDELLADEGPSAALSALPGAALALRQGRAEARRHVGLLARTLERAVIPRLVLARGPAQCQSPPTPAGQGEEVTRIASQAMRGDLAGALATIAELRGAGWTLERIYLELLAPAARQLGQLWEDDACSFTDVTVGLCCLQQVVLENSHGFRPRPGRGTPDRQILLAPVPGEQHSFGLLMVGEFFRRQGWDVCSATGASAREIVPLVRKQWFAVAGFSLSCESRLDALASLIRDIRRGSRNPHIGILVGGKLFIDRPELTALVGADATATDGQQATLQAETLLALLSQEA